MSHSEWEMKKRNRKQEEAKNKRAPKEDAHELLQVSPLEPTSCGEIHLSSIYQGCFELFFIKTSRFVKDSKKWIKRTLTG